MNQGAGYVRAVPDRHRGTVLTHLSATAPLRLFAPRITDQAAWLYSTTLGGGLVGGDDIRLTIDVEAGARVLAVTQASTKVYRSTRACRQRLDATVGAGAVLVSLPDPVVPFAGSIFEQRQRIALHTAGSVLAMDGFTSGRLAFGEHWACDRYANRFEVLRDGRPMFYDHVMIDAADQSIAERMRPFNICLVLVAMGPAFAPLATAMLARVAAMTAPAARRGESGSSSADALVVSASMISGGGVLLRLAAVSVERATATLREWLVPILPMLGDDPWARRP